MHEPVLSYVHVLMYVSIFLFRSTINDTQVQDTATYGGKWNIYKGGVSPEDHGTSHMSIVDSTGMAVALTSTVNTGFGSKVLSPSTGILLNNQMDDFSTPNQPNVYGIRPSPSNYIYPGKKPMSSMSPMVIQRGKTLKLVIGASGGPRIVSAVFQTIMRVIGYGEDLFSSVVNPRLHHQLVPNILYAEQWNATKMSFAYDKKDLVELIARGHEVQSTAWGAVVQGIQVRQVMKEDGTQSSALYAVSDARKDGSPAGY